LVFEVIVYLSNRLNSTQFKVVSVTNSTNYDYTLVLSSSRKLTHSLRELSNKVYSAHHQLGLTHSTPSNFYYWSPKSPFTLTQTTQTQFFVNSSKSLGWLVI